MMIPSKQKSSLIRKKEFYAYCAGLFDGEGSLYIHRLDGKKHENIVPERGHLGIYHRLMVKITNTNKECLEFIKIRLGGNWYEYIDKRQRIKPSKIQYTLSFTGESAMRLLSKMFPYLIIKKEQAKIGIEFQSQMIKDSKFGGRGYKVLPEKIIWREKQRQIIKELNRQLQRLSAETPLMEKQ